jgi:hypothetical protein
VPAVSRRDRTERVYKATLCVAVLATLAATVSRAAAERDPLAELLARTDAVIKEVTQLRGLRVKKQLPREIVDRVELRRRLLAHADDPKTRSELAAEGLALARWGLIPRGTRYDQLMVELLADQVAGYYDHEKNTLVIAREASADLETAELVLAHEVVHALQDQAFDLEAFGDVPASEGDAALARRALVEGDGIAVMIELALARQGIPPPWANRAIVADIARSLAGADELERSGAAALDAGVLERAPLAVREAMLFPYRAGFAFVAALREHEPWTAVDAAFKRPPRSTEQVLHVGKYLADERPIAVTLAAPPELATYDVLHSTVWGELGFALFLRALGIPAATAAQAAAGWGGGRVLTLARSEGAHVTSATVGLARFAWDSEADAIEAHEALVRALDRTLIATTVDHEETRTRWLGVDGTLTTVERRDDVIDVALGVPVYSAARPSK